MPDKPKATKITTPKGRAVWPKLNKADFKYKPEGEYNVKIALTPEEAQPIIDILEKELAEFYAEEAPRYFKEKKKKLGQSPDKAWKPETDKEGNETGFILIKFGMKETVAPKGKEAWKQRPALFDALGAPMSAEIGGGSTIRVSGEVNKWISAKEGAGVSLRLKAVQVLDLKQYQRDGTAFGFEKEEGYVAQPVASSGDNENAGDAGETSDDAEAAAHGNF